MSGAKGSPRWGWLGAVLAVVVAAGCAPAAPPPSSPTPATDLVAARRAAGIADCPRLSAAPVAGGLPELELD